LTPTFGAADQFFGLSATCALCSSCSLRGCS
jgi:hypothetical protein